MNMKYFLFEIFCMYFQLTSSTYYGEQQIVGSTHFCVKILKDET